MEPNYNRWVEVHIEALENNLREVRRVISPGARIIAVVKADAYGLGAAEMAHQLAQNEVDFFAVTFLSEALELRSNGLEADVLIFSPLNSDDARTAIEYSCTITIGSLEDFSAVVEAAGYLNRNARVHIKVDTGLGRFGFIPEDVLDIAQKINDIPNVTLEGIYTHFSEAGDEKYTRYQFSVFYGLLNDLEKNSIRIPLRHCCNSAAFLKYPEMHLDGVRLGTILGGQYPGGINPAKLPFILNLKDPFRFKARITALRDIKKGSYIGYGRTYRLRHDASIAIIPVGFADGLGVEASPKPTGLVDLAKTLAKIIASFFNISLTARVAKIHGKRAYIRGKVFMQFCQVELPPDLHARPGDEVELPVRRTMVSGAIPRIYCRGGEPGKVIEQIVKVNYVLGEE
ncbi:MAG: alanine racemase [Candidatus Saccharibacteria bacterium]